MMSPLKVTPITINNFKQNKPSLIAMDLQEHFNVPPDATWRILLARGVCKWMAVRKLLIRYKHELKQDIRSAQARIAACKKMKKHQELAWARGYLAATVSHKKRLRALFRSRRWFTNDCGQPDWIKDELLRSFSEANDRKNGRINPDKYRRAQEHIRLLREELRDIRNGKKVVPGQVMYGNRTEVHGQLPSRETV
jgi:hypothetical protein